MHWIGGRGKSGAMALGRGCVRGIVPCYRLWWTAHRHLHVTQRRSIVWIAALFTHRATVYATFVVVILTVAAQSLHAREYGGFIGAKPLLQQFVTQEEGDTFEELVEGPATRATVPTFRAASVRANLVPTVLGAEVAFAQAPATAGFALVQPVLTDDAIADTGRKGITTYTVEQGDTPSTIAERFGLTTATLFWANSLQAWSVIQPGQALKILPTDGVTHIVKRGETLEQIAKRYTADAEEILEFNRLVDADDVEVGDFLIVPGGKPPAVVAPAPRRVVAQPGKPPPSIAGKLFWPSTDQYRISQYFTWRHHGVDIAVKHGTSIFASDAGVVESSGWIRGYGYQVTMDHGNGLKTRYAHNSKLFVTKGQRVDRGQEIALVGSTGRSTGPHIHFEVFANGIRVNPFTYLR